MGFICEMGVSCVVSGGVMKRQREAWELAVEVATGLNPVVDLNSKERIKKLKDKAMEVVAILKNGESEAWL